jgi:hypothetical protein
MPASGPTDARDVVYSDPYWRKLTRMWAHRDPLDRFSGGAGG